MDWVPEWVHQGLTAAGFIPGVGLVPDLVNTGLYATEGNVPEALLSASSAIPVVGDAFGAFKAGSGLGRVLNKPMASAAARMIGKGVREGNVQNYVQDQLNQSGMNPWGSLLGAMSSTILPMSLSRNPLTMGKNLAGNFIGEGLTRGAIDYGKGFLPNNVQAMIPDQLPHTSQPQAPNPMVQAASDNPFMDFDVDSYLAS